MRNEIKKSDRLLRQYEEQYGFNSAINNKIKLSESKEKEDNSKNSLSWSDISRSNKKEKENVISIESKEENKEIKKSFFKRMSVNFNYKNNMKKYMKIILNEKKHEKKTRRVEQLTKLFSAVETVEKKEIIDDNKYFKVDKIQFIPFYREKLKNKKKIDYNYVRNRNKLNRNKINFSSEEKYLPGSNILIFSNVKSEENIKNNNTNINNKKINGNKKNHKIFLSSPNSKSNNINSYKYIKKNNLLDSSNNTNSTRNRNNIILSALSIPNINNKHYKKNFSLLSFSPIDKKRVCLSGRSYQKSREMRPLIHKTLSEGKKINNIIKKNYIKHKEPKIKNKFLEILDEQKLDLDNLRKRLKLKDSNGIYGKIDEVGIIENNIKKMEKHITKGQINMIRAVARKIIKEDLLLNKRLVYNVGLENRTNRQKYLELYNILTNARHRKRKIEQDYNFGDNNI